ncbi:MAG: ABC transporter permease [Acidobacteriota bacterium]
MELRDVVHLTSGVVMAHRLRTFLTMLGITIGTASVILLTSIGEGLRVYILHQFTQFGTNIISLQPGKAETFGMPGVATTQRKVTLDDALALLRVPGVLKIAPVCFGSARVEAGERGRSVVVYGVSPDAPDVWQFHIGQGTFLPQTDLHRGAPVAVLGPTLKRELFGTANALGERVHIGGRRFAVVGVMEPKGQMLGLDLDDTAYIPVALAMKIFNKEGLMGVDVLFSAGVRADFVEEGIRHVVKERHDNEEDFTIITQTEMLESLNKILNMITMAIGAIAAISLVVGSIGILTMMWISVNERVGEIGLEKAVGAEPRQILLLFLSEAVLLSTTGGVFGVLAGIVIAQLLGIMVPALPVEVPVLYVGLSLLVSICVGIASGVVPARRAARLDPLEALRAE